MTRVVLVGTVNVVLIPASDTPPTSYVCILAPSGCVKATVFNTPLVRVSSPVPTTYETIYSSISASTLSVVIPENVVNGDVLASDTVVLSAVKDDVVGTIVVSGLIF